LQKPKVDHLKVFGSVAYAKVPEKRIMKFKNKSQKCIFLGYRENLRVYKLYDPIAKKVVWLVDVKFDEK